MNALNVATAVAVAAEVFNVRREDILSPRRNADICLARHAAVGLAWEFTAKVSTQIARALGGRDHSTILNSRARCEELRATDPEFAHRFEIARGVATTLALSSNAWAIEHVDALETARRILRYPGRAAISASVIEIEAMALALLDMSGELQSEK